ncbi:MAG TPA: HD domain-containing phosphohydrolase [Vicinamibacteria bacterium]|jgi:putative nucleotidyltransferase with HDIG domain|nr:HD domain-containing phosphohydrolase [Vicinamibacteria bacterium]
MALAPSRILVVDDEPSFGSLVAEVLTERGFETVSLSDPLEALQRAGDGSFAAAVLDLVMPKMSGLELADGIRGVSPDTQILILTGHGDMDSAIEGIRHGVFDYIGKANLQMPRLERSVRQAVERWTLLRQNRELLEQLSRSNRHLRALLDVGVVLTGEPHLDRLLAGLVASAKELCGASAGRAVLFEPMAEGGMRVQLAVGDGSDSLPGARLGEQEGIATLVAGGGEAVLVVSAQDHPRYSVRCDEMPMARSGFLSAGLHHGGVRGALSVAGAEGGAFSPEDRDMLASLARQAAVAIENALAQERAINFFTHTSEILVSVMEGMDIFPPGHSRGVAALSDMMTRRLGMTDAERRSVHFAGLLHDIGKIRLDPAMLKSPNYASPEVRHHIQQHPALGAELLKPITVWADILPMIHGHHEWWNGKGYPRSLSGEEIPLGARVVAVAEAFDAMTRGTPYGGKRSPEDALREIQAFAGTQFDPKIARVFVAEYRAHGEEITSRG